MTRAILSAVLGVVMGLAGLSAAWGGPDAENHKTKGLPPEVQDLGHQQYRIGLIHVDKAHHRFTVVGVVHRLKPPLEFLAEARGGQKGYESLLELGASAHEFNLACILIGLDADKAKPSRYHFDPRPVQGDKVALRLSWAANGKTVVKDVAELLQVNGKAVSHDDWIYTGSVFTRQGEYLAHLDGTLVGFAHDPASIIEHRAGLGLNDYGAVGADPRVAPPKGTRVIMTVEYRP